MRNLKVKTMIMAGAMMLLATGCGKVGSNTNQGNKTNDVIVRMKQQIREIKQTMYLYRMEPVL